jgi:hypothetical protein
MEIKQKRRIVPTLIGPTTIPAPVIIPFSESLLEKQTKLLGPALVLQVTSGRATEKDFEHRLEYLKRTYPSEHWTMDKLLAETAITVKKDIPARLKAVIDKWTEISEKTVKKPRKKRSKKKSPKQKKSRKHKSKSRRSSKAKKSRSKVKLSRKRAKKGKNLPLGNFSSSDCMNYTVKKIRDYARNQSLPIPGKITKKDSLCRYLRLHEPVMATGKGYLEL